MADGTAYFKIACPHCGVHIEFPKANHGEMTTCPSCTCTVTLRVPGYVEPIRREVEPVTLPRIAKLVSRSDFVGWGCLVQFIGVVLLFFFPLGTIIGLFVIIGGHRMAYKHYCGGCGNKLADKNARLCGVCHSTLEP